MAYLGREPLGGEVVLVDSIESQFNGVLTTFNLTRTVSGVTSPFYPVATQQLLVSLGGVIQKPDPTGNVGFRISFDTIIFAVAPVAGASCFIVSYGNITDIGTPADGTVTPAKLSAGGIYWNVNGNVGIGTTNPTTTLDVRGNFSVKSPSYEPGVNDSRIDIRLWDSINDSDISSLFAGSNFGSIIEGEPYGHFAIGIRDNNDTDAFSIISGGSNWTTDSTYDKIVATFRADGRIGIGTITPETGVMFHIDDNSTGQTAFRVTGGGSSSNIGEFVRDIGVGTAVVKTAINGGGTNAQMYFQNPTNIFSIGSENVSGSFHITDDTYIGTATTRFTINSTGNVGIGSTQPTTKLDVAGTIRSVDTSGNLLTLESTATTGRSTIKFLTNGNDWEIGARGSDGNPNNSFYLYDNASSNYRMVVNPDGSFNVYGGTSIYTSDATIPFTAIRTDAPAKYTLSFGGGNSFSKYTVNGAVSYAIGIDDGDNDKFKISYGATDNANVGTNDYFTIQTDGNVGIGTNTSTYKLTVDSTGVDSGLRVLGGTGGGALALFQRTENGNGKIAINCSGSDPQMFFEHQGTTEIFSLGVNENIFEICDNVNIGTNQRFTINSTGNVGIGTTTADARLEVQNSADGEVFRSRIKGSTNNPMIRFLHYESGYSEINANGSTTNALNLAFSTGTTERLRLTQTGNFGIGTTNPSHKLQVIGNVGIGTIISINPYDTVNGGTLSFEGSSGQLFSITNSLQSGSIFSVNDISGMPSIDVNANGTVQIAPYGGNVGIGKTNPSTALDVNGTITGTTKNFLINHPTQPGKKLRHGSLEGPENAVYVRGKTNTNIIELPEYWTGLVDEDSITVSLTPIGTESSVHTVLTIENNTITISSETGIINCFYIIFGERKDVEKMEIVTE